MTELIHISFQGANAIQTGLLLFTMLYWVIVMLGALDMGALDFEVDVDVDADVDVDMDGNAEAGIGWLNSILAFFNLGKVPFMVWLTVVAVPLWAGSVLINAFFGISSFLAGLLPFAGLLLVSLFLAKMITYPLIGIFSRLDEDTKEKDLVGDIGQVSIPADEKNMGQVELLHGDSYITVYIKTRPQMEVKRGEKVLLIEQHKAENYYLVEPYNEL